MAIFSIFTILFTMILLDAVWLGIMLKRFYAPQMEHLITNKMSILPAVIFYCLYAIALYIFVVGPELKNNPDYLHVLMSGLLFGLAAYGTYDLTNQVTLKDWPWVLTIVDMAWGSCLTGMVSVVSTCITRYFW